MMKRILCLALCLMFALPAALAETTDTLPKRFVRQMTGGNGVRGYASITASGVAEWLNLLLPFTAADIQIRAIGEKQGEMSESIDDDDDWQIKFYVKDSEGKETGTTWLFGDPEGIYFQSELLPDTRLSIPVEKVQLLYQLFRGEFSELFFSFDPLALKNPGANGNASAYEAVAELLGVPAEEWEAQWMPVLEKYFLQLDLWLAGYGDPAFVQGDSGALTMSAAYYIPAEDLKQEAKYLIGQMMYDSELQNLLIPYVSMEQRVTYLNPQMLYFYEACIDALVLKGDISLSREMSALGEVVNTSVSIPVPALPESLVVPLGKLAADLFDLPYEDLLAGLERITMTQSGNEKNYVLSGANRTVHLTYVEEAADENAQSVKGTLRVTPNADTQENAVVAAFSYASSHRIWQDEKYLEHDTTTFSFAVEPDLSMLSEDDPFRNSYVEFKPVSLSASVDYRNNPYQENSAVQVNINVDAKLPDAEVSAAVVLRVTTQMAMAELSGEGAENCAAMTDERKEQLLHSFCENAASMMMELNADAGENSPAENTAEAEAAPTAVPPMAE